MIKELEFIDKKIIELQSQVAFQEDTINTLNEVVSGQQQEILRLKAQHDYLLAELKVLLRDLDSSGYARLLQNEKPPHY